MTSFAVRLKEIADKTNRNADDFVRDVVEDIATKLVERSPVGDPALWQHPAPKGYEPGAATGNSASTSFRRARPGTSIRLAARRSARSSPAFPNKLRARFSTW